MRSSIAVFWLMAAVVLVCAVFFVTEKAPRESAYEAFSKGKTTVFRQFNNPSSNELSADAQAADAAGYELIGQSSTQYEWITVVILSYRKKGSK